jgi:hypothetical protein
MTPTTALRLALRWPPTGASTRPESSPRSRLGPCGGAAHRGSSGPHRPARSRLGGRNRDRGPLVQHLRYRRRGAAAWRTALENRSRFCTGSFNDLLFNARVKRFAAQPAALATIQSQFTTTGRLRLPVVNDHTLLDPIVRARQELVYCSQGVSCGGQRQAESVRGPAVRPLRLYGGGADARVWAHGSGDGRASSRDLEDGSRAAGASIRGLRAAGEADARVTAPARAHC